MNDSDCVVIKLALFAAGLVASGLLRHVGFARNSVWQEYRSPPKVPVGETWSTAGPHFLEPQ